MRPLAALTALAFLPLVSACSNEEAPPGATASGPEPLMDDDTALRYIRDIPGFEDSTLDGARDTADLFCGFISDLVDEGLTGEQVFNALFDVVDLRTEAEMDAYANFVVAGIAWRRPEHGELFEP